MKKCILCLLLICSLFLFSCGKQEKNNIVVVTNLAVEDITLYQGERIKECDDGNLEECEKVEKLERWLLHLWSIEENVKKGNLDTVETILNTVIDDMTNYGVEKLDPKLVLRVKDILDEIKEE